MESLIIIPGLFGSRLMRPDGRAVWPPRPSEFLRGALKARRAEALLDPALEPAGVLETFACRDIYGDLIGIGLEAGFRAAPDAPRRLVAFAYDWRRDLRETAARLAERIDRLDRPGERWFILAHSMGGLLARALLETGPQAPWRRRIRLLAALGAPHLGAPAALARIAGRLGGTALSAEQTRRLAADPRYPGPSQLVPPPQAACVFNRTGRAIDVFSSNRLGLPAHGMAAARALHAGLDPARRPQGCRYVFFAGVGEDTITRLVLQRGRLEPVFEPGGDGAVGLVSAGSALVESRIVEAGHSDLFRAPDVREALHALLGRRRAESAGLVRIAGPDAPVAPRSPVSLRLFFDEPVTRFDGGIILEALSRAPGQAERVRISYAGPPVRRLGAIVPAPVRPGFHAVRLDRAGARAARPAVLAVSPPE